MVASYTNDPTAVEQVLLALTQPDTAGVKAAEAALKPMLGSAKCVTALMVQLQHSRHVAVRQIAAVILRKKIVKLWKKVNKSAQVEIKTTLLGRLKLEPERAVRKSICALVSALARVLVPNKKWKDLLDFISTCAMDPDPGQRELAYLLLLQLSETVASYLSDSLANLAQLFSQALTDGERAVSVTALQACCAFVSTLSADDDVMLFRELVPMMVAVARHAVAARDDLVLASFFDAFADLAQSPVPVLTPHLGAVVPMLLEVMVKTDEELERSTRDGAANVVTTLAEWKPKLLGKANLVRAVAETCLGLMASADSKSSAGALFVSAPLQRLREEELELARATNPALAAQAQQEDDDDDFEGPSSQEIAQMTLDQIALHVPHKYSLEPVMSLAMRCLEDPQPSVRRAGVAVLGVVAEGFQDAFREHHLATVLGWLAVTAARDTDAATREVLCFAYGQLAEHCQPEIVAHATAVVPVVFAFLDDDRAAVVGTSCYVLEMFCESMDSQQLAPLFGALMDRLVRLLGHRLMGIREMAAAAVGSAAVAAKKDLFEPYLHAVAGPLAQMCTLEEEKLFELRGRSLDALGHIAMAVGPAAFAPYRDHAIAAASRNLEFVDSVELAEYAYGFFANISKVMRRDFAPLLPQLAPHLMEVIARSDGASFDFGDDGADDDDANGLAFLNDVHDDDDDDVDAGSMNDAEDDEEWEDDNDDDDDDLGNAAVLQVRTAMMNTKRSALVALGNAAEYADGAFAPHLDRALEVLRVASDYFHHEIRERAAIALQQVAHAACVVSLPRATVVLYDASDDEAKEPPAVEWTKGDASARLPNANLAAYVDQCVLLLVKLLREDTAKSVVAVACEALGELLMDIGPAALIPAKVPLLEALVDLAQGKAPCQTLLGDDDGDDELKAAMLRASSSGGGGDEEEDDEDHDNVLMDNVADLTGSVAKVAGALLGAELYDAAFLAFSKFTSPSKPASDRAMALGCYAELVTELPPHLAATRHFPSLQPLFFAGVADPHASVARNAAFGLGALFAHAPAEARPHYPAAFQALLPLIHRAAAAPAERAQADRAAADNAVAAMARLALADAEVTPLADVLTLILPLLPLTADVGENKAPYQLLAHLVRANHPTVQTLGDQLKRAFADALSRGAIDDPDVLNAVTDILANVLT